MQQFMIKINKLPTAVLDGHIGRVHSIFRERQHRVDHSCRHITRRSVQGHLFRRAEQDKGRVIDRMTDFCSRVYWNNDVQDAQIDEAPHTEEISTMLVLETAKTVEDDCEHWQLTYFAVEDLLFIAEP
uniref:Uncharacterized protein n=1 Tax=Ascaris lumbricoides TaxID=6252 RepID=A0A9J2PBM8_ASCLU